MDHLVLAGPPGHPLERLDVVPVQELDRVELVSFRAGAGLRHAADIVLEEAGVTPQVVVESNEMPVLVGLVSHGVGLAIIPHAFVEQSVHQVWARPLAPPITPSLILIWRDGRRRSPAAEAFLRHIAVSTSPPEDEDPLEAE
jgi:DNA-binding transcriptional LysR family regulator